MPNANNQVQAYLSFNLLTTSDAINFTFLNPPVAPDAPVVDTANSAITLAVRFLPLVLGLMIAFL